jgi:hypothetical protein
VAVTLRRAGHVVVVGVALAAAACDGDDSTRAVITAGTGAMAVVSVAGSDTCSPSSTPRVTAVSIWIDGIYDHEVLLFPGTGQTTYDSLIGPLAEGRHDVDLRPSAFWKPARCLLAEHVTATAVEPGTAQHDLYRHAPVLELRADTVGEQSDIPLYSYAEHVRRDAGWTWRYTVVFSNEDGGTPTRALLARWGRTTDIEQVYEITTVGSRITREEFQGPDHVVHPFQGRRQGDAPILLVATLNNMVTDRGRGVAPVRLVPDTVDLARATRESTMDTRPWVYRVMENELATEGRIAADAPMNDAWPRVAPDPLSHIYLEAELRLDRAVAVAWVQDLNGRRYWSHYLQPELAIDRNGWVRSAVAVGSDPGSSPAEVGWACLAAPGASKGGSCEIEATRAFLLTDAYRPGANLIAPIHFVLEAGDEVGLSAVRAVPPGT